ncbi:MAG: recombination protein O N-terminal domain-containing protein [Lentisphaeria bacterium]|nr:recombination protein O N-terminal domain-containing protein [Lentisphaeria bacterium]
MKLQNSLFRVRLFIIPNFQKRSKAPLFRYSLFPVRLFIIPNFQKSVVSPLLTIPKPVIQTDFLVLRKMPYSETSLIVAGLSPTRGQLRLIIRGGRKIAPKQMPVVDIFRLIHVTYVEGKSGLHTWRDGELLSSYGDVARDFGLCETAAWLARFTLSHSVEEAECPRFFLAARTGLKRLAEAARGHDMMPRADGGTSHTPPPRAEHGSPALEKKEALSFAVKNGLILVYLSENGLLPDYPAGSAEERQLNILIASALDHIPLPDLGAIKWRDIFTWGQTLLRSHAEENAL